MRRLPCKHVEVDEIWTFVGKKQRRLTKMDWLTRSDLGDQYVFIALDADTRLIPAFRVGKRTHGTADKFLFDLSRRLNGRIQLTTDAFTAYPQAVNKAWGSAADYATLTKVYKSQNPGPGRYAPPEVAEVIPKWIQGRPDPKKVSTSYVERHNLTVRMQIRRFTRLTNGFSKKLANLKAMLALYFVWYNFVRVHGTLRVTPAMEAGITDRVWRMEKLLSDEVTVWRS